MRDSITRAMGAAMHALKGPFVVVIGGLGYPFPTMAAALRFAGDHPVYLYTKAGDLVPLYKNTNYMPLM